MDECITKHRAKHFVCEFCNEHFSDEPCEPSDCEWMNFIDKEPAIDPASLRATGEWISVEERLPQEGGSVCENVILLMDNGLVTVGWLNQITNRGYYLDTINDVVIKAPLSRFTHWMPLPEPPNCGAKMKGESECSS